MDSALLVLAGCLLVYASSLLPRIGKNYVSARTFLLASRVIRLFGIVLMLAFVAPEHGPELIFVPLFVIACALAAYAYLRYREVISGRLLQP